MAFLNRRNGAISVLVNAYPTCWMESIFICIASTGLMLLVLEHVWSATLIRHSLKLTHHPLEWQKQKFIGKRKPAKLRSLSLSGEVVQFFVMKLSLMASTLGFDFNFNPAPVGEKASTSKWFDMLHLSISYLPLEWSIGFLSLGRWSIKDHHWNWLMVM